MVVGSKVASEDHTVGGSGPGVDADETTREAKQTVKSDISTTTIGLFQHPSSLTPRNLKLPYRQVLGSRWSGGHMVTFDCNSDGTIRT